MLSDDSPVDAALHTLGSFKVLDLSHEMVPGMPVWPTLPGFEHERWVSLDAGGVCNADRLTMTDHIGTHLDAPSHYLSPGTAHHAWMHEVALQACLGRGIRIDCHDLPARGEASASRVRAWESEHGEVRPGDIVVFDFGRAAAWDEIPPTGVLAPWPGVGLDCADLLIRRGAKAVAVDCLSVDGSSAQDDPAHHRLLGAGILIAENLANVSALPPIFLIMMLPLKIREGSGSPVRAVALIPCRRL